jgi:peroxiredoxin
LKPGQEFLYSGTADWKITPSGGAGQALTGPVQLSALVTEADPAKGYAVIMLRRFDAKPEQPGFPAEAVLGTVRYAADLSATQPPVVTSSPITAILQGLAAPVTPQAELKAGQEWRRKESLPAMPFKPLEIVSTVVGETKVGERAGLKIEKKLSEALPYKQEVGGGTLELTEYGQTVSVDPETGQVLADRLHGSARFSAGDRQVTLEFGADVSLQSTNQLSETELAARVKQAAAIDRVQRAMFEAPPSAQRAKVLADAANQAAAFKKTYPDSPYAPALARLDELLGQVRTQVERQARTEGLKGSPAPAFALKNLAGKPQTLAAYRGKIVVLNFFASWCPPCNAEAPHLEKAFWQKYRGKGVVVVGVNTGERGEPAPLARQFRAKHALTFPILVDAGDKVAGRYGVTAFPTNVVIDRKGVVRMIGVGFDPNSLETTLKGLLAKG